MDSMLHIKNHCSESKIKCFSIFPSNLKIVRVMRRKKHNNVGKVLLIVADIFDALLESDWNFIDVRVDDMN